MDVVETLTTPTAAPAPVIGPDTQVVQRDLLTGERTSTQDAPEEPAPGPVFREVPDDGSPAPAAAPAPERVAERRQTIADLKERAASMREAAQAEAATRAVQQQAAAAEQAKVQAAAEQQARMQAAVDAALAQPEEAAKALGVPVWELHLALGKALGTDPDAVYEYQRQRELESILRKTPMGRELDALRAEREREAQAQAFASWQSAQTAAAAEAARHPHLAAHVAAQAKESGKSPDEVVTALVCEAVEGLRTTDPRAWRRVARGEYTDREVLAAIDRSLAPQPAKPKPAAKTAAPKPAPRVLTERAAEREENKRLAAALVASGGIKKPDEGTETLDDLDAAGRWQEGLSENEINKRLARAWKRTTTAKK